MGTILSPRLGLDHFESLSIGVWRETFSNMSRLFVDLSKERVETYRIAALTNSGYDRQTTKISCTPARARLSKVQSSSVALHTGKRHYNHKPTMPIQFRRQQTSQTTQSVHRRRNEEQAHTLGFPEVNGLNRLLKLSARITACRTSSSSPRSFSFPDEFFGGIYQVSLV